MKQKIKLRYTDPLSNNPKSEKIYKILSKYWEIDEESEPDYILCSAFGFNDSKYTKCVKILINGENIVPDFNRYDYAIGFDYMTFDDRYIRMPLYYLYSSYERILETQVVDESLFDRKFCCFVVSNNRTSNPIREEFFHELSKYKRVDSAGRFLNNMGGAYLKDKLSFVSQYKFNLCCENSSSVGYTTEKIMEPMSVNTMPIYWGNPKVEKDFNPASFVDLCSFHSMKECIEYIEYLDNDKEAYLKKLSEPWQLPEQIRDYEKELYDFFNNIFSQPIEKAHRRNFYGYQAKVIKRQDVINYVVGKLDKLKKML